MTYLALLYADGASCMYMCVVCDRRYRVAVGRQENPFEKQELSVSDFYQVLMHACVNILLSVCEHALWDTRRAIGCVHNAYMKAEVSLACHT